MNTDNTSSDPKQKVLSDDAAKVEEEIQKTQNSIEFQTRALDRLKTIKTGKRKILDILRQNSDQMDKKLLAQLNDRYNDFVLQETEILELLRRTIGLPNPTVDPQKAETDSEASEIMKEIAEVNAQLAKVRARNIELEKEAASRDLGAAVQQRNRLSQRVREIQENNVQKKQLLCKLLFENPDLVKNNTTKSQTEGPNLEACMQAVENTPGTSKEYDEIVKHLEQIKSRRNRMNNIREKLSQATSSQTMDDTYHSALKRLENLSSLRKALEETTAETEQMEEPAISTQDEPTHSRPVLTSTTSVQLVNDSVDEEDEKEPRQLAATKKEDNATECKKVAALSQLNSERGKLVKQRTLERVLHFAEAGPTAVEKNADDVTASALEKEICLIIEYVIPWLKKHENDKATLELLFELRQLVVNTSSIICFPDGLSTNLFENQLTTILDDAFSQFSDDTFKNNHNKIVAECSEILYNELAFFKLMNDIDNLDCDDD